MMANIVDRASWLEARLVLLAEEKAFTAARDALSARRREMPWVRIAEDYRFSTPQGQKSLADLFAGRSQLIVYHFMYGPDWQQPCKSCSFWADNFNGIGVHLNARDVEMVAVSAAPLPKIEAVKARMGWGFRWVSSADSSFNADFGVASRADGSILYNFDKLKQGADQMPGISVFAKAAEGAVYHTYSTYARGLDMLNGAYNFLDLVPKGRDEAALDWPMSWVKRHDDYGNA